MDMDYLKQQPYEVIVEYLIKDKYSISDELAIQRQRAVKSEEFEEYNNYCEECKAKAKEILKEKQNE